MNSLLILFILFTSTLQLNLTTHSQTCFKDNNRNDEVFNYHKHSEISGRHVFFWGSNIFGDKEPVYGHFNMESNTYHWIVAYLERDFTRMMAWHNPDMMRGFTTLIRRQSEESYYHLPKVTTFSNWKCSVKENLSSIVNSSTTHVNNQGSYSCFKTINADDQYYFKKFTEDYLDNVFFTGYHVTHRNGPKKGILYGYYHIPSKMYVFYVFFYDDIVHVFSWKTLTGSANGFEYSAKLLLTNWYLKDT